MADPFVDPLDEEAEAAERSNARSAAQRLRERVEPTRKDDETDEVSVETPPEPDDEEEIPAAASRRERRAGRQSARERAAAAEATAAVLRERLEASERQRGQGQSAPTQTAPNTALAEIDARIRANITAQEAVHDEWGRKATDAAWVNSAEGRAVKDRAIELEMERSTLAYDRREAQLAPKRAQDARAAALRLRAPDVYDNPKAFQYAYHSYAARVAAGEPDGLETHDAVMEETRRVVLGKRPAPDAAQRQRASGISAGGRGLPAAQEEAKIAMPRGSALYRMATARYPELDPADACKKWAQVNGKAYLARTGGR